MQRFLQFLLLTVYLVQAQSDLPRAVKRFVEKEEQLVIDSASKASELHARRVQLVRNCECSRHACANDFQDAECVAGLKTHNKICKELGKQGEGRLIDFDKSIFRTPRGENVHNLAHSIKENICIYKHMEDLWRKKYKKKDTQWIFLGKESPSVRSKRSI